MARYRPTCPRCRCSLWYESCSYGHSQIGCSCGFRMMGDEAVRGFVAQQKAAWELEQIEAKARVVIDKTSKAKKVKTKSGVVLVRQSKPSVVPMPKKPVPTPAQKRRGAVTLTQCAHCQEPLFRRKKEVDSGNSFCSKGHQRAWIKTSPNPTGHSRQTA